MSAAKIFNVGKILSGAEMTEIQEWKVVPACLLAPMLASGPWHAWHHQSWHIQASLFFSVKQSFVTFHPFFKDQILSFGVSGFTMMIIVSSGVCKSNIYIVLGSAETSLISSLIYCGEQPAEPAWL